MRVVFMGTPDAAVPSLQALVREHDVASVYTQPDRPRGRGRRLQPSPVKIAATAAGRPVVEPRTLRDEEEHDRLRTFEPEVVVVVAYGKILPPEILSVPERGCVNVHFSLLPRWRGAAPVERAIIAGDEVTGVTTMLMDEGLDTGPVLERHEEPIRDGDTAGDLRERLAGAGAELLLSTLRGLEDGSVRPVPQPEDGVTYAEKISPEESGIDWTLPAAELARLVHGLAPSPGAATIFRGKRLKIWRARAVEGSAPPGVLAGDGLAVGTGGGLLRLDEVQPEGKRRMDADDFRHGYQPEAGEGLGS